MFVPGQIYRRRDLHREFGGQQQGGISTPSKFPVIFLFTGESGTQHGYRDGWQGDDLFFYTGEGQRGDMRYVSGNRAIRDHLDSGKDLHLFEQAARAHVRYIGQFVCTGSHLQKTPGTDGAMRNAIVFELVPIADFTSPEAQEAIELPKGGRVERLSQLRELAIADSAEMRDAVERRSASRKRSEAIRAYVLERACGHCEGCKMPAPFLTPKGAPYLEPHHIRRLSDGGPDHPLWVIAVCANCHRRAHYSNDAPDFNRGLLKIVDRLEGSKQ
jgi:5-methylcytosine-specific restriction protein A